MAKHSVPKGSGTSKFRMVVIDAELQEGEIGQLVQAIQGAFSGQRAAPVRPNGPAVGSLPSPEILEIPAELDGAEVAEDAGVAATSPAPARPKSQKKLRTPNLDPNLHPGADPSLKAYAEARNVTATTSVLTKFLTVASWLHEERDGMKMTADRAYTCFRFISWPFNIDFYQPLRDLRAKNYRFLEMKPEDKGKGEFSMTHLGLDKATKMKSAS
jgi:hypothetical protein